MTEFIIKRILGILPVALGVVTFVALMTRFVPGDPVDAILGDYATVEDKAALRESLGLDASIGTQLTNYFGDVVTGDLGSSLIYNRPVLEMVGERLPATLELAVISLIVAILLSIPLGIISALKQNTAFDYTAMGFAVAGVALPNFWLGPLLVLCFSLELDWLPVSERGGWQTYVLPAITMGTALAAALSRMTRNSMLDTLQEDYVRTARAKGCSERIVVGKHALRNAALPLVTIVGLQFGVLLTGAIITEKIFDWPGVGTLLLEAIQARDYPVVQGCVLLFSGTYLLVNLATDLIYALVDPRIKVGES